MRAPSPFILAAHIQLPEALMSCRLVTCAEHMFVSASATVIRAMAAGLTSPRMGCSPTVVAIPVSVSKPCATSAWSASGVCSGPTHCCCAISPETERSTLLVRKRFEPTESSLSTRPTASFTVTLVGSASGVALGASCVSVKTFLGISPSTSASDRSTGVEPSRESKSTTRPSPVTSPRCAIGADSRSAMRSSRGRLAGEVSSALFSWYSAPQISSTDIDLSPQRIARTSMRPPIGSQISLSTLPLPPAPWSWMAWMGLSAPRLMHARMMRFILFSISASPRCTALKLSAACLASTSTSSLDEAAPPPIPMR
mmetsp:Transcript_14859/g.37606  ORF Transcript_14859/g.37606 Transcript_14859/m.37606 type:complete len:312 (+) Transcript_14859:1950-2885(+)